MPETRHPLHSMCSYLGCFPPRVPRRLIHELVPKGGSVLDPFCGSGTTIVEALLSGRSAVGLDLNPLAFAIADAKVQAVTREGVMDRLLTLASGYRGFAGLDGVSDDLRTIYHPRTLAQLAYLREALTTDLPEDRFIRGAVLGIMHGKFKKGGKDTAYLSIDMPNTFSMSPEYVRKFVAEHKLVQLPVDVFKKARARVEWLLRSGPLPSGFGVRVLRGDATGLREHLERDGRRKVDAIITSPPYLGVLRYGAFNWIRLWFLGFEPTSVDKALDSTDSLDRYLSFMTSFLMAASKVLRPGAPVALVIGDVVEFGNNLALAERVWEELEGLVPFKKVSLNVDRFDETVKTTRIWGEGKKGKATPLDRILILERVASIRGRRPRSVGAQEGWMGAAE